jgi:hypothetical protein
MRTSSGAKLQGWLKPMTKLPVYDGQASNRIRTENGERSQLGQTGVAGCVESIDLNRNDVVKGR